MNDEGQTMTEKEMKNSVSKRAKDYFDQGFN